MHLRDIEWKAASRFGIRVMSRARPRDDSRQDDWVWLVRKAVARMERGHKVLDLGCGTGLDAEVVERAGGTVVGIDLSPTQVTKAKRRVPTGTFMRRDVSESFPNESSPCGTVIANLSLHYFRKADTDLLVDRICAWLQPGGEFLCRLNSSRDEHFGATGHRQVEEGVFSVHGQLKRFFDRDAIETTFSRGWELVSVEERVLNRYLLPKTAWQVMAKRRLP